MRLKIDLKVIAFTLYSNHPITLWKVYYPQANQIETTTGLSVDELVNQPSMSTPQHQLQKCVTILCIVIMYEQMAKVWFHFPLEHQSSISVVLGQ